MGNTYSQIQEGANKAMTKEKCKILVDCFYLIPQREIAENSCIFKVGFSNKHDPERQEALYDKV